MLPEFQLTAQGMTEAARLVRQHRLWELYLITHAEIAPSHVDRDADAIEHVLGAGDGAANWKRCSRPGGTHVNAPKPPLTPVRASLESTTGMILPFST